MSQTNVLRRSQLGIPGNESQLVDEAIESDADEVFIDLEDSLAPSEKNAARKELIRTIEEHDWDEKTLTYRINGTDTRWWHNDIIDVIEKHFRIKQDGGRATVNIPNTVFAPDTVLR